MLYYIFLYCMHGIYICIHINHSKETGGTNNSNMGMRKQLWDHANSVAVHSGYRDLPLPQIANTNPDKRSQ